jgi:O-antigen ligase
MIWLLIGYMWLFIHRPFEIWPVLGAFRIERVYMIGTIICWLLSRAAIPSGNRLHRYFALFVAVILASWLISPYRSAGDASVENYLKYSVFYVLLVTSVRSLQDLRTLAIGHFCIVSLLMAHTLRECFNGNSWYAQGIVRMQGVNQTFRDPNDFAGLVVSCLPFAWSLWQPAAGKILRVAILGHVGLVGYCVMLTGSRMGMVGMVLAGGLATLASPKRWRWLTVYGLLLAAVWVVLPADRKARYLTLVDPNAGPSAAASSGGRLRMGGFEAALPVFAERPLLGFGPDSFAQASGSGHMPHNLYGQLLAELGAAGAVSFALIIWGVARNTRDARHFHSIAMELEVDEFPWRTVIAVASAFFLLLVMAWGFNFLFWHIWLWFGGFQVVALRLLKHQAAQVQFIEEEEATEHLPVGNAWT